MRHLLVWFGLVALCGCADLPLTEAEQIAAATNIASNVATGNYTGAVMEGLDVVAVLLGWDWLKKGGRFAKSKLVNPKYEEEVSR